MQAYISQLADINKRLHDAINQLREQQKIVSDIDCPRWHEALPYAVVQRIACLLLDARSAPQTYSALKSERPPRGGLSEIRSGVLIRRRLLSARCASQTKSVQVLGFGLR